MNSDLMSEIDAIEVEIEECASKQVKVEKLIKALNMKRDRLNNVYSDKVAVEQEVWECWLNEYPWNEEINILLNRTFHLKKFRPPQLAAINATLSNIDVLIVMPPGEGKSLCYQLPSLFGPGVTLVISPLASLMECHIRKLTALGIIARKIVQGETVLSRKLVYDYLERGALPAIKLLYTNPEMLVKSKKLLSALQKCSKVGNLNRIAIDDVHCCSEKDSDYRPEYRLLTLVKTTFPGVPIIGVSATATASVLNDVRELLDIPTATVIKPTFDRANLIYKVLPKPSTLNACVELINNIVQVDFKYCSGIVYVCTIEECEQIAKGLKEMGKTICVYHDQLTPETKSRIYKNWIRNICQLLVTTTAYGLKIDKPDVRIVIHYGLPRTLEDVYRQAGTGGRDGKQATCIVLYRLSDCLDHMGFAKSKTETVGAQGLLQYSLNVKQCRHSLIGWHLEEKNEMKCGNMCDNCKDEGTIQLFSLNRACAEIYQTIDRAVETGTALTLPSLIEAWFKWYNVTITETDAENIIGNLLRLCILKEEFMCLGSCSVVCYLKKNYETPPKDGVNVHMVTKQSLLRYLGPSPISGPSKRRENESLDEPSTSQAKVPKIGE